VRLDSRLRVAVMQYVGHVWEKHIKSTPADCAHARSAGNHGINRGKELVANAIIISLIKL